MFEAGKKVIAIKNCMVNTFKKGDIFTLLGIRNGCCNEMDLAIWKLPKPTTLTCVLCGHTEVMEYYWYQHDYFKPLSDMQAELSETTIESILEPELENV